MARTRRTAMTPPMHAVAYLVTPEPENRDELLQTLRSLSAEIRRDAGCVVCAVCREDGGDLFIVVSGWKSRPALERHLRSEHFRILSGATRLLGASAEVGFLASEPFQPRPTP